MDKVAAIVSVGMRLYQISKDFPKTIVNAIKRNRIKESWNYSVIEFSRINVWHLTE